MEFEPNIIISRLFEDSRRRRKLRRGWHVARRVTENGSSARCRSLPPGKPSSDARPRGPLTCCLCDLWRLEASGHCRLLSSLSSVSPRTSCTTARSHTHCATFHRRIQRGIPRTCRAAARAYARI
ncbi:unnamed protein product [Pleuronectes platessa]|uniref:Uncharacterized protein n=1 Tax=Pleuronectes platessa TaxID=8262 RepID=A0A9N7VU37_PLEPL|nr:unnamed protein product [Pleuronectes platessa]